MDPKELWMTVLRGLGVYILMLVVLRLMGKRTVGNFSAFDLLVALMLGEVVDEIIYGDVKFIQGSLAIVVIAAAKYATSWLSFSNTRLAAILEGTPTVLVENGEIQQEGMRKELMNDKEIMAALRLREIDDLREVKHAVMETDGEVSVIKEDWAEAARKIDLGGKKPPVPEKVPEDKQTDSKKALMREK